MALSHTLFSVPFAVWTSKGFVSDVPHEIDETAYLDGYGFFRFFLLILLPLIRPGVGTAFFDSGSAESSYCSRVRSGLPTPSRTPPP
jgi:ABC-type glycerol-3-phosphate transport system permease component